MGDIKKYKRILITGGTSGLGRSLVNEFLANGFEVVALGRQNIPVQNKTGTYEYIQCDFSKLDTVKKVGNKLSEDGKEYSYIINNAGILSPPGFHQSENGFELSYQVNFLSHVLLTQLLLPENISKPQCIVNISSPIYVKGRIKPDQLIHEGNYHVVQAYAQSKLFMALFSEKLYLDGFSGFSFNPGTFSSGIYRMQQKWFHHMYKIAAPFMVSSDRVAKGLYRIIHAKGWSEGKMVNRKGKISALKTYDAEFKKIFWNRVDTQINNFLSGSKPVI